MDALASFPLLSAGLAIFAAYLVGSLSFAVLVSRLFGLKDPRTYGSKNPGATNVLRSGNKLAAIVTLLFDALKGALPVMGVAQWGAAYGLFDGTLALVGFAAFLGHVFPIFFRFQGGKGVATALGVLCGIDWALALIVVLVWALVLLVFRYVSLASIIAAIAAPICYVFLSGTLWPMHGLILLSIGSMGLFLVYRHRENLERLLQGKESRLGSKK